MTETVKDRETAIRRAKELREQGYRNVRIARKGYQGLDSGHVYHDKAKQPTEYLVMGDK